MKKLWVVVIRYWPADEDLVKVFKKEVDARAFANRIEENMGHWLHSIGVYDAVVH